MKVIYPTHTEKDIIQKILDAKKKRNSLRHKEIVINSIIQFLVLISGIYFVNFSQVFEEIRKSVIKGSIKVMTDYIQIGNHNFVNAGSLFMDILCISTTIVLWNVLGMLFYKVIKNFYYANSPSVYASVFRKTSKLIEALSVLMVPFSEVPLFQNIPEDIYESAVVEDQGKIKDKAFRGYKAFSFIGKEDRKFYFLLPNEMASEYIDTDCLDYTICDSLYDEILQEYALTAEEEMYVNSSEVYNNTK